MGEVREIQDSKLVVNRFLFFLLGALFAYFLGEVRTGIRTTFSFFAGGTDFSGALSLFGETAILLAICIALLFLLFNQGRWVWIVFLGIFLVAIPEIIALHVRGADATFFILLISYAVLVIKAFLLYLSWAFREELAKVFGR